MYYIKIPLRHLCRPEELRVPEDRKVEAWNRRVASLMEDLAQGIIPHWAIEFQDMKHLKLEEEN